MCSSLCRCRKVHAMTRVSLGFKNQWGCLGDKMRVTQRPVFDKVIVAINKLIKTVFASYGNYFLDYTGPMMGEAVPMNIVIAGMMRAPQATLRVRS